MLEGRCAKCGTYRYGWALRYPRYQTCPSCGAGLKITEDGAEAFEGFSPFTAQRIDVKPLPDAPVSPPKKKREKEKE